MSADSSQRRARMPSATFFTSATRSRQGRALQAGSAAFAAAMASRT
jgi:hypothetical protein